MFTPKQCLIKIMLVKGMDVFRKEMILLWIEGYFEFKVKHQQGKEMLYGV